MGQYLTPDDVRDQFSKPLLELAADFGKLCDRWEATHKLGDIARPDLLINDATPKVALGSLYKLQREINGKLEDAIAGVYRYRDAERLNAERRK